MPAPWILNKWGLSGGNAKLLAAMNDEGESFDEIADWIEANL